jgi:hypothetical protein
MTRRCLVPVRLDRILSQAVSCALLSSLGACGGATEPEEDPPGTGSNSDVSSDSHADPESDVSQPATKLTGLACFTDGESQFGHMQLARDYDYLAFRTVSGPGDILPQTSSEVGVACGTARDPATCLQALDAARPGNASGWRSCSQICTASGVVTTRGDEVRLFDSADELVELLGAIDTPHEAALLANAKGYTASCLDARYAPAADGFILVTIEMVADCPIKYAELTLEVSSTGAIVERGRKEVRRDGTGACVGRRPDGLLELASSAPCAAGAARAELTVGYFFAEVAQLEESAVAAFAVIEHELAALGAPASLRRAARRAARDERRHTELTSQLARRYGVEPEHPRIQQRAQRALFEFALDNVIEGCVRETYGAACARYQALRSSDTEVRATLAGVARDEARHAELSWRIHDWARSRLNAAELERLRRAAQGAIAELRRQVACEPGDSLRHFAGVPGPAQALAILDALEAQLWSSSQLAA